MTTLTARCHCGATRIRLAHAPTALTACNCSFCFKRGALWAYYPVGDVLVLEDAHTVGYSRDPALHTHYHCAVCGCGTHSALSCTWTEDGPDFSAPRIAVNARLLDDVALAESLPVEALDGRGGW